MSTGAADTTVRQSVVVEAPIERAFRVFTEDFGSFKPPEHNMLSVEIAETVFEPRVGGHLYDRGVDGSECRWARILAYEPPSRVVFSWDISPHWQVETDLEQDQRGRGALHRGNPGAHAGRARASSPGPARRWLGWRARGRQGRRRMAALPAAVRRAPRPMSSPLPLARRPFGSPPGPDPRNGRGRRAGLAARPGRADRSGAFRRAGRRPAPRLSTPSDAARRRDG